MFPFKNLRNVDIFMVVVIKIPKKPRKFSYFHGFGDQNTKKAQDILIFSWFW